MGWFTKDKKSKQGDGPTSLPELPKLPELPNINNIGGISGQSSIPQLPSYPTDNFGEKFSQGAIKDAVSGEEEDEEEEADEFQEDEEEMMSPLKKPLTQEIRKGESFNNFGIQKRITGKEPVFVRLDKFEEGIKIFDETKLKIMEIEKILRDLKRVKEKEEKELQEWDAEIQNIKGQFEKIDRDIFSKVY